MDYDLLDLRLTAQDSGRVQVWAASREHGDASGDFDPPFPVAEVRVRLKQLEGLIAGQPAAEHPGTSLYRSLLGSPAISALYNRSLGALGSERGLRVRLMLDIGDPRVAEIGSYPWELAMDPETGTYLFDGRRSQLERYLLGPQARSVPVSGYPLRVLALYAAPEGALDIDANTVDRERAFFRDSLGALSGVQVSFLQDASLTSIRSTLDESVLSGQPFHAIHYLGHGSFRKGTGVGYLNLEKRDGSLDMVDAATLAAVLSDYPSIRVVVLDACRSAVAGLMEGQTAYLGLAQSLIREGLACVVAMQELIAVESAVAFSEGFYPFLARGYPLAEAMAAGRARIRDTERSGPAWATPVLFSRIESGYPFEGLRREETGSPAGRSAHPEASVTPKWPSEGRAGNTPIAQSGHADHGASGQSTPSGPAELEPAPAQIAQILASALSQGGGPEITHLLQVLSAADPDLGDDLMDLADDPKSAALLRAVTAGIETHGLAQSPAVQAAYRACLAKQGDVPPAPIQVDQTVHGDANTVIGVVGGSFSKKK